MIHATQALSYIDPGTGSMLFTLIVGLISASYFFVRKLVIRLKVTLSGGASRGGERLPYVIFSDDKRYWNVFGPICDEFERRGLPLAYWTVSPDDPALSVPYEHVRCEFIGEGNRAFARLNTMSADVVLATTPGLDVYQWKRSKDVGWYAHIFHAVGSMADYRMFSLDFYDEALLAGDIQGEEIRELEVLRDEEPKRLTMVGSTYMDSLAARLVASPELPPADRRTVLLAPTWGPNAILAVYGEKIIEALVSTGWRVVVRPHPQTLKSEPEVIGPLLERWPEGGPDVEWNRDVDNFDCLHAADVLITDFSGIIYDYALVFDGPVIYAEGRFDPTVYDAAWFDHPLKRFGYYEQLGIALSEEQLPHMGELLEQALANKGLAQAREMVRDEIWQCRGEAASRVADALVARRAELVDKSEKGSEASS
ncbi:MAG: CDP-glycerol glycerophosphotransferase family protein [Coriobacteriales bacterium]|nr:CDP-glycerol glycerophosphotransferase family protein [Coriobacteriales bacterium]